jgi:hypothetical protein
VEDVVAEDQDDRGRGALLKFVVFLLLGAIATVGMAWWVRDLQRVRPRINCVCVGDEVFSVRRTFGLVAVDHEPGLPFMLSIMRTSLREQNIAREEIDQRWATILDDVEIRGIEEKLRYRRRFVSLDPMIRWIDNPEFPGVGREEGNQPGMIIG